MIYVVYGCYNSGLIPSRKRTIHAALPALRDRDPALVLAQDIEAWVPPTAPGQLLLERLAAAAKVLFDDREDGGGGGAEKGEGEGRALAAAHAADVISRA